MLQLHTIGYDLQKLKADGCELVQPVAMFRALMVATLGDPCTTGCAYYAGGQCEAFKKYHSWAQLPVAAPVTVKPAADSLVGGRFAGMTSAQIREKEGISRAEFQRRKLAGNYRQ